LIVLLQHYLWLFSSFVVSVEKQLHFWNQRIFLKTMLRIIVDLNGGDITLICLLGTGWPPAYTRHEGNMQGPSQPLQEAAGVNVNTISDKPEFNAANHQQSTTPLPYQQDNDVASEST